MAQNETIILGAGMTGLAAGLISGATVYEASDEPGGICSSYYIRPHEKQRLKIPSTDGEVYRFETGGGHWIFGGDPALNHFIQSLSPIKSYNRRSSVYFRKSDCYMPYPLQNHLSYLDKETALKALLEMTSEPTAMPVTMSDWLYQSFGKTLTELFFAPFNKLYTAGLWNTIAPQDSYKSPINIKTVLQGAMDQTPPAVGYNTTYLYPVDGLNMLAQNMAKQCKITYGKKVVKIDPKSKEVFFENGSSASYNVIISTLPLNRMMDMTGLSVEEKTSPYSSVLVLNIGARRGEKCPNDHWLYNPDASSGFHRVGFYSNVDVSFLPRSSQKTAEHVSIYVERAFPGSSLPDKSTTDDYTQAVIKELQDWEFINDVEVVDPTWIDVAYTWSWPKSNWKELATRKLQENDIFPFGRYARWSFQGIADSLRDGFYAGSCFK